MSALPALLTAQGKRRNPKSLFEAIAEIMLVRITTTLCNFHHLEACTLQQLFCGIQSLCRQQIDKGISGMLANERRQIIGTDVQRFTQRDKRQCSICIAVLNDSQRLLTDDISTFSALMHDCFRHAAAESLNTLCGFLQGACRKWNFRQGRCTPKGIGSLRIDYGTCGAAGRGQKLHRQQTNLQTGACTLAQIIELFLQKGVQFLALPPLDETFQLCRSLRIIRLDCVPRLKICNISRIHIFSAHIVEGIECLPIRTMAGGQSLYRTADTNRAFFSCCAFNGL